MKAIGAVLAAGLSLAAAGEPSVREQVAEDIRHEIRPGGIAQPGFWTRNAMMFMYRPSLEFARTEGARRYAFTVCGPKAGETLRRTSDAPVLRFTADEWAKLTPGFVQVVCEPKGASGQPLPQVQSRFFWKKPPFAEGGPTAVCGYAEAARRAYAYLIDMPFLRHMAEKGAPDPAYDLNCYPSKMHPSVVRAMLHYAKLEPSRADAALKLARASADYLLSLAEPKDAPLAGFTPTYSGDKLAARKYAGESMNSYPAGAGSAFLSLYEATKERKYLDAAELIAATYLRSQGEDGTWPLKQELRTGKVIGRNRLFPIPVMSFLGRLHEVTGREDCRAAADRAFAFIENGPLKDWNWEGQFEDVEATDKYVNLTKHPACSTAIHCLKRFPGDAARLAQARDIIRFSEDQFVDWKRPFDLPLGKRPPIWGVYAAQWTTESLAKHRYYPAVSEQYRCYVPVDASAAKLIRTYLALYRAEGKAMDLAKARALGDMMTRVQRADGSIPTWWDPDRARKDDWINCMIAAAESLEELAAATK